VLGPVGDRDDRVAGVSDGPAEKVQAVGAVRRVVLGSGGGVVSGDLRRLGEVTGLGNDLVVAEGRGGQDRGLVFFGQFDDRPGLGDRVGERAVDQARQTRFQVGAISRWLKAWL